MRRRRRTEIRCTFVCFFSRARLFLPTHTCLGWKINTRGSFSAALDSYCIQSHSEGCNSGWWYAIDDWECGLFSLMEFPWLEMNGERIFIMSNEWMNIASRAQCWWHFYDCVGGRVCNKQSTILVDRRHRGNMDRWMEYAAAPLHIRWQTDKSWDKCSQQQVKSLLGQVHRFTDVFINTHME